ncbi:ninjurin-A-like isoform X2 [Colias croceus]|uniref:ninjurin-A-like isoform X2 n=1 Tax=Colias crocea TaxID=72248 RepID=UPI001E27A2CB|nr:ninjurin-A-like isoform X2 [Colias croceus]
MSHAMERAEYRLIDMRPYGNKPKDAEAVHPSQPLLEPDKHPQTPPLAGPEIDDLEDIPPADSTPYPGIDDGLLEPDDKKNTEHDNNEGDDKTDREGSHHSTKDDGVGTEDDAANGFGYRFGMDDRPISPMIPGSIPDVNTYQQKKNLAQGMMDLALLSANANQLRYVLESASSHPYYYPSLTFIALSIVLQIGVGVGLIMNSRYNVKDDKDICKADKINNFTVLGVFLVTIVNVFITSFSVASPTASIPQATVQQAG